MTDPFEASHRFTVSQPGSSTPPAPHSYTPPSSGGLNQLRHALLLVWLAAAIAVCVLSLAGHMLIGLNNDLLTLTDQTQKWLEGGEAYVDFLDTTPPFIYFLFAAPQMIAGALDLPPYVPLYLMSYFFIALALLVSGKMLRASFVQAPTRQLALSTIGIALLGLSFIHNVFADREHLMMSLIAPWLVLYSPLVRRESVPAGWRMMAAVMAAAGFAIKPHFYAFYIATALFTVFTTRNLFFAFRQPEHYIVWAVALVYHASLPIFFPPYLQMVIPIELATYAAISWSWEGKLGVLGNELLLKDAGASLGGALLLFVLAPRAWDRVISYLLLLLAVASALFLFGAGWSYTYYPFLIIALVLGMYVASKLIALAGQKHNPVAVLAVLAAFLAALWQFYVFPSWERGETDARIYAERGHTFAHVEMDKGASNKLEGHLKKRPRFVLLSTNFWGVNLIRGHKERQSVGRFDYLWPLPGLIRMQDDAAKAADYGRFSNWIATGIADDLNRHAPSLVIIDTSPVQRSLPNGFSIIDWLKKNPEFAKAWQDFDMADIIDNCAKLKTKENCAYDIYYRK